ncbi:hypothetical protein COP1_031155 [Malus domestica]
MIQELFGGAGLSNITGGGERKSLTFHGGTTSSPSLSPSPSPSSSTTTTATATTTTTAGPVTATGQKEEPSATFQLAAAIEKTRVSPGQRFP